ncbi:MAG TPA: hypothetical protein VMU24_01930, partial [Candidatus Acidoferrales bacterium]|nr:hypothetical protein [Candidatus Acidoferrales bacterium]
MQVSRTTLKLLTTGVLLTLVFGHPGASAQTQLSANDRSFYLNHPVVDPESLSGIWEAADGRGGAVGIHLELATTLPGDTSPPIWTPQSW